MPRRASPMKKGFVYSKPTRCLHCHLVVEMYHELSADPHTGAWECPQCAHKYPFAHWKIKKGSKKTEEKPEAA
jgi:hypothetical protein